MDFPVCLQLHLTSCSEAYLEWIDQCSQLHQFQSGNPSRKFIVSCITSLQKKEKKKAPH